MSKSTKLVAFTSIALLWILAVARVSCSRASTALHTADAGSLTREQSSAAEPAAPRVVVEEPRESGENIKPLDEPETPKSDNSGRSIQELKYIPRSPEFFKKKYAKATADEIESARSRIESEYNLLVREAGKKRIAEGKYKVAVPDPDGKLRGEAAGAIDGRNGDLIRGAMSKKGVLMLYELPFDEYAPVYYSCEELFWLIAWDPPPKSDY